MIQSPRAWIQSPSENMQSVRPWIQSVRPRIQSVRPRACAPESPERPRGLTICVCARVPGEAAWTRYGRRACIGARVHREATWTHYMHARARVPGEATWTHPRTRRGLIQGRSSKGARRSSNAGVRREPPQTHHRKTPAHDVRTALVPQIYSLEGKSSWRSRRKSTARGRILKRPERT